MFILLPSSHHHHHHHHHHLKMSEASLAFAEKMPTYKCDHYPSEKHDHKLGIETDCSIIEPRQCDAILALFYHLQWQVWINCTSCTVEALLQASAKIEHQKTSRCSTHKIEHVYAANCKFTISLPQFFLWHPQLDGVVSFNQSSRSSCMSYPVRPSKKWPWMPSVIGRWTHFEGTTCGTAVACMFHSRGNQNGLPCAKKSCSSKRGS